MKRTEWIDFLLEESDSEVIEYVEHLEETNKNIMEDNIALRKALEGLLGVDDPYPTDNTWLLEPIKPKNNFGKSD